MKNLAAAIKKEVKKNAQYRTELINTMQDANIKNLDWRLKDLLTAGQKQKSYSLKELKAILKLRLSIYINKKIESELKKLQFAELQEIDSLTINVIWKKSATWGMNPTAEAFIYGLGTVSSGSITGCGYDKQSTAVANVLNQVPQFLQKLYELKNKKVNISNSELFGYGSGSGLLPYFAGGVGVNCYPAIFEKIGYKFETVCSGKMFDCYRITKIEKRSYKKTVK